MGATKRDLRHSKLKCFLRAQTIGQDEQASCAASTTCCLELGS